MRLPGVFSFRVLRFVLPAVFVWVFVAWAAAEGLVVRASLGHADAIVVLSGSGAYVERTTRAAELFHEGRAPLVVLTNDDTRGGWSNALQRNPYFVERATDELIKGGVPADRIKIAPGIASSTRSEALIIKDYAVAENLRSILVVTSGYHSRRALRSLNHSFEGTEIIVGLEPVPVGRATPSPVWWWLQPEGWRTVAGEYVKLVYYWFKYG
jgi:uncharacterized SAM-binding protein YcdF (DUF218 family)